MPSLDGIFEIREVEYSGVIHMMKIKKEWIQGIVMGVGIPAVLVSTVVWQGKREGAHQPTEPPGSSVVQSTTRPILKRQIPVVSDGQIQQMELEEYLLGVLLAEVPASFEPEALKAQAVAARTYTLWCCTQQSNHVPAAVCMQSHCCQSYISPLRYIQQGGNHAQVEKMRAALAATEGEVVSYQGELILATYFSCSGGSTEAAVAVWGQEYPYLQSVESPGEENGAYFTDQKEFNREDFEEALGITLTGVPGTWFGVITYTPGGGVKTLDICGITFEGTDLRKKLDLRSTAFTISASAETITVYTRGHGHRVGLSQYGADAMALTGKDYRQILSHYYPGTAVQSNYCE